jgi:hypothetical protein
MAAAVQRFLGADMVEGKSMDTIIPMVRCPCVNESPRKRRVFALMKRSAYGIHHHMSRKYLGQYCAERDFVYNNRRATDDERADRAIEATRGKRLMLKAPKGAEILGE